MVPAPALQHLATFAIYSGPALTVAYANEAWLDDCPMADPIGVPVRELFETTDGMRMMFEVYRTGVPLVAPMDRGDYLGLFTVYPTFSAEGSVAGVATLFRPALSAPQSRRPHVAVLLGLPEAAHLAG